MNTKNYNLKMNLFFFFSVRFCRMNASVRYNFSVMLEFSIFCFCSFMCNEHFTNLFLFVSYLLQFFISVIFTFCRLQFFPFLLYSIFFKTAVYVVFKFFEDCSFFSFLLYSNFF